MSVAEEVTQPQNETKNYSDGTSATGPGPLPDLSPAQQEAQNTAQQVEESVSGQLIRMSRQIFNTAEHVYDLAIQIRSMQNIDGNQVKNLTQEATVAYGALAVFRQNLLNLVGVDKAVD